MFDLSPAHLILVIAVGAFTAAAAVWDIRTKRIPNKLTLPFFFAGWVFQIGMSLMYGWHHLGSAALGFLVGFGILFVLWFVGGGGGGDVKLMGALSVWLGFKLTLYVLMLSVMLVLVSTLYVVLTSMGKNGLRNTKQKYLATGKTPAGQKAKQETQSDKVGRRVMAFAGPVAVATWIVVMWNLPLLTTSVSAKEEVPQQTIKAPLNEATPASDTLQAPDTIEHSPSTATPAEEVQ